LVESGRDRRVANPVCNACRCECGCGLQAGLLVHCGRLARRIRQQWPCDGKYGSRLLRLVLLMTMSDAPRPTTPVTDLRTLLLSARGAIRTLHVGGVETVNLALCSVAAARFAVSDAGSQVRPIVAPPGGNDGPNDGIRTFRRSIWWKPPNLWRDDEGTGTGEVVSTLVAGSQWTQLGVPVHPEWPGLPLGVTRALKRARQRGELTGNSGVTIENRLRDIPIVAPGAVASSWQLTLKGATEYCGRRVQSVRARRGILTDEGWASDIFSDYEWLVDDSTGILLRASALVDQGEARVFEVRACAFDHDIPASVFEW